LYTRTIDKIYMIHFLFNFSKSTSKVSTEAAIQETNEGTYLLFANKLDGIAISLLTPSILP
jgi:hypothetical protein